MNRKTESDVSEKIFFVFLSISTFILIYNFDIEENFYIKIRNVYKIFLSEGKFSQIYLSTSLATICTVLMPSVLLKRIQRRRITKRVFAASILMSLVPLLFLNIYESSTRDFGILLDISGKTLKGGIFLSIMPTFFMGSIIAIADFLGGDNNEL